MKKVLSIVLSIAMVLCMMPAMAFAGTATASQAAAAYSDTEGTPCEGAVNVLSALGVVSGYTDGTYKPEQVVTRAEMAKLIVTALGVADYATAKTSKFTDMGAAEWAIPYVEYASNLNIVNGYGYGLFGPNDTVTYEQAVTMIVRALGYTDDCNEMNGSWPAIYIQKATALGLFENVDNGGSAGADRGDVAIMLYNALDCAEVYPDKDGVTNKKTGAPIYDTDGTIKGYKNVTMMDTLNKSGTSAYAVVTSQDADDALTNIRPYVGAGAKITKDKNGHVIAIGDIKTTFLKGDVSTDGKEFTVGDTVYDLPTALTDYVDINADTGAAKTGTADNIVNGATQVAGVSALVSGKGVTLAVEVSGKTIKKIYSVSKWTADVAKKVVAADLKKISSNSSLLAEDFKKDDNGEIDYTTFQLLGVDSLDDIAADNIVAVYVANDKITKVEVGTEVIEGTVTAVKSASKYGDVKYTIGDATYKASTKPASDGYNAYNSVDPGAGSNEILSLGDEVKAYLDYSGKIYTTEAIENSYNYGVVLKAAGASSSYDTTQLIRIFTAAGEDVTYTLVGDNDLSVNGTKPGTISDISVGELVKYKLDSKGKITDIIDANTTTEGGKKITTTGLKCKNGVFNGLICKDDMIVFSADASNYSGDYLNPTLDTGSRIDAKNLEVGTIDLLADKTTQTTFAFVNKKNEIVAMVIDDAATNAEDIFGVVNTVKKVKNSDGDEVREITGIFNGVEDTVLSKSSSGIDSAWDTLKFVEYAGSVVDTISPVTLETGKTAVLSESEFDALADGKVVPYDGSATVGTLGSSSVELYQVSKKNGDDNIYIDGNYQVIKGAKVYRAVLDGNDFDKWEVSSTAEIGLNDYVALFQTDKKSVNWDTVLFITDKDFEKCDEFCLTLVEAANAAIASDAASLVSTMTALVDATAAITETTNGASGTTLAWTEVTDDDNIYNAGTVTLSSGKSAEIKVVISKGSGTSVTKYFTITVNAAGTAYTVTDTTASH